MWLPIPSFVPVPSPETIRMISVVLLAAGIFLMGAAVLLLSRGRGMEKENSSGAAWVFMGIGVLLVLNHGLQLLF